MDSALITGMAAVLGSLAGASASIATTWMTQRNQKIRERALRRRETLYKEFIIEVFRLTADAFQHSLERPETLVNAYAILGQMQLLASAPVIKAAEECCLYLVDLYSNPNMTIEQIYPRLREPTHPLIAFGAACRLELDQYAT